MSPEHLRLRALSEAAPISFRAKLFYRWLAEATEETTTTLYANRMCDGLYYWGETPQDRLQGGKIALANWQIQRLIETASNPHCSPELQTVPVGSNGGITNRLGFDVWGLGQNFQPILFKGDCEEGVRLINTPDNYWLLENVFLR